MTGHAAVLLGESLLMTALLIAAVLAVRRPVAALLGARMAYALWMIPALRLILPPLPGGETVVADLPGSAPALALAAQPVMVDAAATPGWSAMLTALTPWLLVLWLAGALTVLAAALLRHHRWLRSVRRHGTPLDPVGRIGVVMSDCVDGPVATGLLRPLIVVPADFFARYNRAERQLAIEHELAHHRAGDLWANVAALAVLAAQWFNPLAWRAVHGFRFDQEAACDARVLSGAATGCGVQRAHSYACAIAKSAAGPRLLLAAPMKSGTKVKERLQMLNQNPRLGLRPVAGRLLLGGATMAALALTVSSLPARVVYAAAPAAPAAVAEVPAPPRAPSPVHPQLSRILVINANGDAAAADGADSTKRTVRRLVIRRDGDTAANPAIIMFDATGNADRAVPVIPRIRLAMPVFGANNDELRATLKEQGIDDAKADAIVKQLEAKRGAAAAARAREAADYARLSIVPLISSKSGFPITERTYLKLRHMSVPVTGEKEMLERTLKAMTAARDSYARGLGDDAAAKPASNPEILNSLDREIKHLTSKINRL